MVSVTLFASSFGGIVFGAVADRIGRKKALMATVLLFSICSGLSGLAQNLVQLAIARTLLGIGMGGEWASGALLVSETWPAKHRGKAIGLMQGGWGDRLHRRGHRRRHRTAPLRLAGDVLPGHHPGPVRPVGPDQGRGARGVDPAEGRRVP